MRYGKLHFTMEDYETAMESFNEVTKIVPNYYGGWLKFAQSCIALGLNKKAKQAINKALQLNPYEERINALNSLLNSLLKNNRRK
jgi:Flp pilus assembly protein TadD